MPNNKKVAIVLSGGGSKGDFQLGALTALYEADVRPDIICATSVGALNALMLTQGGSGLDDLRKIWLGLRRNDHMWLFEDWWQDINPQMREAMFGALLGNSSAIGKGEPWSVATGTFAGGTIGAISGVGLLLGALVGAAISGTIQNVTADAFKNLLVILNTKARSLINLIPIRNLMTEQFDNAKFSEFVNSGKQLRLAVVGLESGELCYVTETGDLLARDGVTKIAGGIPIVEGAMASASIAAVFPPVNFANDAWVDGGHRECIPLQAAIQTGATEIYVISASPVDRRSSINRTEDAIFRYLPSEQLPPQDFESRKILDIANRAVLSIHLDEMAANDIYPFLDQTSLPIKVIAPEYSVHDLVTIDPELIRVNYDYGYRSAWDVLSDASPEVRADSSIIALSQGRASRLRKIAWRGIGIPFSTALVHK